LVVGNGTGGLHVTESVR